MHRLGFQASLLIAVVGCQVVTPGDFGDRTDRAFARAAMPGEPSDPPPPPDSLSLAADCLARGDDAGAANYLTRHVSNHPDQLVFRAQLADVLARLDRLAEAQAQFEAATACAQDGSPAIRGRLVHYHTRLMEIARRRGDPYTEHLHRGIGLYLVAVRLAKDDSGEAERLLCKAASALKDAQSERPDEARPAWYLYCVWSQLDQPRPAERALRKAIANAPFSNLTPAEARDVALAKRTAIVPK